eukprot:UN12316
MIHHTTGCHYLHFIVLHHLFHVELYRQNRQILEHSYTAVVHWAMINSSS